LGAGGRCFADVGKGGESGGKEKETQMRDEFLKEPPLPDHGKNNLKQREWLL